MTPFSVIYDQVLMTLQSNNIAKLGDEEITRYLDTMILRAVAEFRFPKIPLTYHFEFDNFGNKQYVFDETITQREINVLLVLVKQFWLEQQLDNESRYEDVYYDRDVRTFSRGNMMKALQSRYELSKKESKTAQYNYGRVGVSDTGFGEIYDE